MTTQEFDKQLEKIDYLIENEKQTLKSFETEKRDNENRKNKKKLEEERTKKTGKN